MSKKGFLGFLVAQMDKSMVNTNRGSIQKDMGVLKLFCSSFFIIFLPFFYHDREVWEKAWIK